MTLEQLQKEIAEAIENSSGTAPAKNKVSINVSSKADNISFAGGDRVNEPIVITGWKGGKLAVND